MGDFGKLGMLRKIADSGLKIGVNWYLTYKPEEHFNDDGKHIGYLNDVVFMNCDDELREALRVIVRGERSVKALENANLLAGATYYIKILKPGNEHNFIRLNWHKESLKVLADTDIVF